MTAEEYYPIYTKNKAEVFTFDAMDFAESYHKYFNSHHLFHFRELVKTYPNDGELGKELRKLIKELCYTK